MTENLITIRAKRTAFIARFIVLRESKRAKAHRLIELMEWEDDTTAEQLFERFYDAFVKSKDNLSQAKKDLNKAMEHTKNSFYHFVNEYSQRATTSFLGALFDFDYSNKVLFTDNLPRNIAWRTASEVQKDLMRIKQHSAEKSVD